MFTDQDIDGLKQLIENYKEHVSALTLEVEHVRGRVKFLQGHYFDKHVHSIFRHWMPEELWYSHSHRDSDEYDHDLATTEVQRNIDLLALMEKEKAVAEAHLAAMEAELAISLATGSITAAGRAAMEAAAQEYASVAAREDEELDRVFAVVRAARVAASVAPSRETTPTERIQRNTGWWRLPRRFTRLRRAGMATRKKYYGRRNKRKTKHYKKKTERYTKKRNNYY